MTYICETCGFEIKASIQNHVNSCDGLGPRRKRPKNKSRGGGWNRGKSLEETNPENHEEIRKKLSENHKGGGRSSTEDGERERRRKLSNIINERYNNGWDPVCGRAKKYKYTSKFAGVVTLDGTWELKTAIYLDENNIRWKRPAKRFNYIKPSGKRGKYKPDFWIDDWNSYLEVKGYKTDLDDAKWSQFKEPLIVWFRKDLIKLGILRR